MKIINVCGARPNFMKIAPLMRAFAAEPSITPILVHTGQHYDEKMSKSFFDELNIPRPDINLEVGSGSHAQQTGTIMQRFEGTVLEQKPDAVLVVGDVNSTMACALVAVKLEVAVYHVEAGLRSFDRGMPEEINRLVTDAVSDVLFVSEPSGMRNLQAEGIAPEKTHFVGNVMIDTLKSHLERAQKSNILSQLGVEAGAYVAVTLHRPSNVDDAETLGGILDAFDAMLADGPVLFPIHPRTRKNLASLGLQSRINSMKGLRLIEPLGYLDFLKLTASAAVVVTDSGGVQEETTILGVPCLTVRENTERPATVVAGTNRIVGTNPAKIIAGYRDARGTRSDDPPVPEKWDGRAAERIVKILGEMSRAGRYR